MEESKSIWLKKAPITVVGVLVIGIVCSAIYDIFVKPGINGISELIFNIVTLGSQKVKDYAFNNAALDPTALPALILLTATCGVISGVVLSKIIRFFRRKTSSSYAAGNNSNYLVNFGVAYVLAFTVLMFVYLTVQNQSIIVWRVFNANVHIVAPFIAEHESLLLKSKFSSMTKKSDYQIIQNELSAIAEKNGVKLRNEETW